MKKKASTGLCLMILGFTLCFGVDEDPLCISGMGPVYLLDHKETYTVYVKGSDIALLQSPQERGEKFPYDIIKKEDIRRDINGFPVARFFGRDAHFLLGGNYVTFRFLDEKESGMVYLPDTCRVLLGDRLDIYPSGVEVNCPSYLIEGTKHYSSSNLTKTFMGGLHDGGMIFNTMGLPWAEGEEGSGIGLTLSIQFIPGSHLSDSTEAVKGVYDSIVIMNGYVDFYRPDLFLKNNRVKKVRIKATDGGSDFEQEYELKDIPEFQVIRFPRKVGSVDMTIKDVYQGSRYNDTVLTSILPMGNNWTKYVGTLDKLYEYPQYVDWRELDVHP